MHAPTYLLLSIATYSHTTIYSCCQIPPVSWYHWEDELQGSILSFQTQLCGHRRVDG